MKKVDPKYDPNSKDTTSKYDDKRLKRRKIFHMMDQLDVVVLDDRINLQKACDQGMTFREPVRIDDEMYCFAIRINEKINSPENLIVPNLTQVEGTKSVYSQIDFNQYGNGFKKLLKFRNKQYFMEIDKNHCMEEILSKTSK